MTADHPCMNPSLLDYLCCPQCRSSLVIVGDAQEISDGRLLCTGSDCGREYPVARGVPVLLPDKVSEEELFTAKSFGEQWQKFHSIGGLGEEFEQRQFYEYFHPFDTRNLAGKTVVEAGCGYGRNLRSARECGAEMVIGFDVGPAALIAKQKDCDTVVGDILAPPLRGQLDIVFSFGVIHHVSDPDKGIKKLFDLVADNGWFCHSVYSAENNWFLEKLFTPLRVKIFRYWPVRLKYLIAQFLGIISYAFLLITYKPFSLGIRTDRWASEHLFYYDYLILTVNKLGLKQWIGQLYDHFNAPSVEYIKRTRIEQWISDLGLQESYLYFRNKNTWNFGGKKVTQKADPNTHKETPAES